MLPPIEPDESLVAYGLYQQLRRDRPTDVQEHWTVHSLPDGASIWRSQLLRSATLLSACYLLRDPEHAPLQMVFFWRWQGREEHVAEYQFMPGYVSIFYQGASQEMILPAVYEVYGWHTITENFIWMGYDQEARGTQAFNLFRPSIQDGTLWPGIVTLEASLKETRIAPGGNGPRKVAVFTVEEPEVGTQQLFIDEFGVPLRWALPSEHLTVTLAEYTRVG